MTDKKIGWRLVEYCDEQENHEGFFPHQGKTKTTRLLTAVGTVGEPELLGQECRESLLGMSQMDEGTVLNSGQLCCGSSGFGRLIPLNTKGHSRHVCVCVWRDVGGRKRQKKAYCSLLSPPPP